MERILINVYMPGVTKHIYEHDINDIISMWNKEVSTIRCILPIHYGMNNIIDNLKEFYPYEWQGVEHKYRYYNKKDEFLKGIKEKHGLIWSHLKLYYGKPIL